MFSVQLQNRAFQATNIKRVTIECWGHKHSFVQSQNFFPDSRKQWWGWFPDSPFTGLRADDPLSIPVIISTLQFPKL